MAQRSKGLPMTAKWDPQQLQEEEMLQLQA